MPLTDFEIFYSYRSLPEPYLISVRRRFVILRDSTHRLAAEHGPGK
jgi:hypothetical protein